MSSSNPSSNLQTSPPSPPLSPEEQRALDLRARKRHDYETFKHYASLGMIVLAPTIMLIPPRKFDLYTVALSCGFVTGASYLSRERYGVGLIDLVGKQVERMKQEESVKKKEEGDWKWSSSMPTERAKELQRQIQQSKGTEEEKQTLLKRIWMGGEDADWKEKRAKEHAEALERGETIGDLVRAQISEVWNWGEKQAEDLEQKDREVVEGQQKKK